MGREEIGVELDDYMFKDKPVVEYNPEDSMGRMIWTLSLKAILCYRGYPENFVTVLLYTLHNRVRQPNLKVALSVVNGSSKLNTWQKKL